MTKFQEVKERADVLEDLVNAISWTKQSNADEIQEWERKLAQAEEDGQEDTSWEEAHLARYKYRLSVIKEVEKMLEKML